MKLNDINFYNQIFRLKLSTLNSNCCLLDLYFKYKDLFSMVYSTMVVENNNANGWCAASAYSWILCSGPFGSFKWKLHLHLNKYNYTFLSLRPA